MDFKLFSGFCAIFQCYNLFDTSSVVTIEEKSQFWDLTWFHNNIHVDVVYTIGKGRAREDYLKKDENKEGEISCHETFKH